MELSRSSNKRSVKLQVYLALIANLSCLAPAMSLGFSAISLPTLTDVRNPNALSKEQASWMASIAAILAPLGCVISGLSLDKYGRKNTLYSVNVCCFVGWGIIVLSSEMIEYQYFLLLVGRSLTGISIGMASMPATVYITEITVPKYRGMFTTWTTISFAAGILVVYALGFIFKGSWGFIALLITILPVLVLFVTITVLPESPVWLVNANKHEEAVISMNILFQAKDQTKTAELERELLGLRRKNQNDLNFRNKLSLLCKPMCFKPLIIMCMFFLFQQFSGTFAILFYAVDIVKNMNVDLDPFVITVFVGIIRIFGCICMTFGAKRYGRRLPSIVSGSGMAISMLGLAAFLYFVKGHKNWDGIPIALFNVFFFINTLGFLSMPFAMAAEVFPTQVRGLASGLCVCFGYLCNFIAVKIYPDMLMALSINGLFCFYGIVSLIGTILVFLYLPETKGKTLAEIEQIFSK